MDKPLVSWWSWFFVRWALMVTFVMTALLAISLAVRGPELDEKIKAEHARRNWVCCLATGPASMAQCDKLKKSMEYKPLLPMRGWGVVCGVLALLCALGALAAHEKNLRPQLEAMPHERDARDLRRWSAGRDMLLLCMGVSGLLAALLLVNGPRVDAALAGEPQESYRAQPKPFSEARLWGILLGGAALLCGLGAAAAHEKLPKVRRDEAAEEASL